MNEGDTVFYFSLRVARNPEGPTSRKFMLLWTGPYTVTATPSASLATIHPLGNWARNPREITTTMDKLRRVINYPVPGVTPEEDRVDMDDIEEDLEDFGEYIRVAIEGDPLLGADPSHVRDELTDGAGGHPYAGAEGPYRGSGSGEETPAQGDSGPEDVESGALTTRVPLEKATSPLPSPTEGEETEREATSPPPVEPTPDPKG